MIQLSLLPTDRKLRIEQLRRFRAVTGYLTLIGICLAVSTGLIVVTNVLLNAQLAAENEKLSTLRTNGKRVSLTTVNEAINLRFRQLQLLVPSGATPVANVTSFLQATPDGIVVTRLTWSAKDGRFVVEGIARDRNTFLDFRRNLEQLDFLHSVQAPISSLSRPTTIPFTITATQKPGPAQ